MKILLEDLNKICQHNNWTLSSNFWLPWHGDICCLLGVVTTLQVVCPATLWTLRKATPSWTLDVRYFPVRLHHPISPFNWVSHSVSPLSPFYYQFSKEGERSTLKSVLEICLKCFLLVLGSRPPWVKPWVFVSSQLWFVPALQTSVASLQPATFGFVFFHVMFGFVFCFAYMSCSVWSGLSFWCHHHWAERTFWSLFLQSSEPTVYIGHEITQYEQ